MIVSTLLNSRIVDQQDINLDKPETLMSNDYITVKLTDRATPTGLTIKDSDDNIKAPIVKPKSLNPLADLQHDVTGRTTRQ